MITINVTRNFIKGLASLSLASLSMVTALNLIIGLPAHADNMAYTEQVSYKHIDSAVLNESEIINSQISNTTDDTQIEDSQIENSQLTDIQKNNLAASIASLNYAQLLHSVYLSDEPLTAEQTNAAQALYERIYNLFPTEYYQQGIEHTFEVERAQLPDVEPTYLAIFECASDISTEANFRIFMRYFVEGYVAETDIDKIDKSVALMNRSFVDDIANIVQIERNFDDMDNAVYNKLQSTELEDEYATFMSSDYDDLRSMIGLNPEDDYAYPFLIVYFMIFNSQECEKFLEGS